MGASIDMGLLIPENEYSEAYQNDFRAMIAAANGALSALGLPTHEEPTQVAGREIWGESLGSYSSASDALHHLDRFLWALRNSGRVPISIEEFLTKNWYSDAPVQTKGFEHWEIFGMSALFLPIDFPEPIRIPHPTEKDQDLRIGSIPQLGKWMDLAAALSTLDATSCWEYGDWLPRTEGETIAGYDFCMNQEFVDFSNYTYLAHRIAMACKTAMRYNLAFTIS